MASETIETHTIEAEGITVSRLVWNRFHRPMDGMIERILDINVGLANFETLPVGAVVRIPIPAPRSEKIVDPIALWS